jgi:2-methylisocitrate lyase-like PEP mutase family enzyme
MPAAKAVELAASLGRVLKVPLSVDIEDGYSDEPGQAAGLALRLADAGVAGINIEDGPKPAALLARKIAAIKDALAKRNADLFVNARTDVFLGRLVEPANLVAETLARARQYAAAGADGIFVPGLAQPEQIAQVRAAVPLPLNLMAWGGLPAATELEKLGVKRLSAGSGIAQAVWALAETLAKDFLETGESDKLGRMIPYAQMQGLFKS